VSGVRQSMSVTINNDTDRARDSMVDALMRIAMGLQSGEFKLAAGGFYIHTVDRDDGTHVQVHADADLKHIPKPKEPT